MGVDVFRVYIYIYIYIYKTIFATPKIQKIANKDFATIPRNVIKQ